MSYQKITNLIASQENAELVYSNGDYLCQIDNDVVINQGDEIITEMAVINSQFDTNNNIVFDEDVNLSIDFVPYDIDYLDGVKAQGPSSGTNHGPTYDAYLQYSERIIKQFQRQSFLCDQWSAGSSGQQGYNVVLVVQYSYVDANGDAQTFSGKGSTTDNSRYADVTTPGTIQFRRGTLQIQHIKATLKPMLSGKTKKGDSKKVHPGAITSTNVGPGQIYLDKRTAHITLPEGTYTPQSLTEEINQKIIEVDEISPEVDSNGDSLFIPVTQLITRTDDPEHETLLYHVLEDIDKTDTVTFTNDNTYRYYATAVGAVPQIYVGASQFALEYGKNGNTYTLTYAHSPLPNPNDLGTQNIAFFEKTVSGKKTYKIVTRGSGIVLTDMRSEGVTNKNKYNDFWDTIIPIREKACASIKKDSNGVEYILKSEFEEKTTQGFVGCQSFYPQFNPIVTLPTASDPVYIQIENATRGIVSDIPISGNQVSGAFLVSASFFDGEVISTEKQLSTIASYGSYAYSSGDYVVLNSANSNPYIHRGVPKAVNKVRIRILDANNFEPVQGLLSNNSVFFRIIKTITPDEEEEKK